MARADIQKLRAKERGLFMKGGIPNPTGNNGLRRDLTMELIQQLHENMELPRGVRQRNNLHHIIKNLIEQATGKDEYDESGKLIKRDLGDLAAIKEIFDRLEGRPRQQIVGPNDGPVQMEFHTVEEVRMFLLERGIDSLRVPPPPLRLVSGDKE